MANQDVLQIKVENVDEKQVPSLIQDQFSMMGELRKEIERASNNAFDAKEAVINEVGTKDLSKKGAIENLQTATLELANAQIDAMNAQKLSFEYQQKLAEITKFLFQLGLTNIAMNRLVVEELEAKLRNATQEELDEMARAEIEDLLKRLKMQQDMDKKQSELRLILKGQEEMIAKLSSDVESMRKELIKMNSELSALKATNG